MRGEEFLLGDDVAECWRLAHRQRAAEPATATSQGGRGKSRLYSVVLVQSTIVRRLHYYT